MPLTKIAVIIANAKFSDPARIPNLKFPLSDADQLELMLGDPNYGGFDRVIKAQDKTSVEIKRLVEDCVRDNRDAFLLIYYSGHGKLGDDGRLFLASADTDIRYLFTSAVAFKELVDIVAGYNHRRVGFVLDCCYAGAAVDDLRGTGEDSVRAATAGKQVFALCGSTAVQTSKELESLGHGVLTAGILEGIKTGAADRDNDGVITLSELFQYCSDFAAKYSHQEPVCSNLQTGDALPIAIVSHRISVSEIERIRARIAFVRENNLLEEDLLYRLDSYFSHADIPRPRATTLEGAFLEYCANRLPLNGLLRQLQTDPSGNPTFAARSQLGAIEAVQRRELDPEVQRQKESIAFKAQQEHTIPGPDPESPFTAITPNLSDKLLVRPSAYPMTPMYLLDNVYRIIDWNEAFSIAFDRTMEGRKGKGILDWTYFLDNYEAVLDHGMRTFGDANALPPIDVEDIEYTSQRYGKLKAVKRAYQIPDDNRACLAWLVTLDLQFADPTQQLAFHRDLVRVLAQDLMWSEYALSYDRVLNSTKVYPELLETLIGGNAPLCRIPEDARIIDLGAGSGNLSYRLMTTGPRRVVYAAENNRIMLELLKSKCAEFLRSDVEGPGIIALKQDITSLFGLDDNYFDFALMNNVLYAIPDPDSCLKEARRVLKPGGELRLTGPRKNSNSQALFDRITKELKDGGKFDELEADYQQVQQINDLNLRPMLYRWSTEDVEAMLKKAGFSKILFSSEEPYAGQAMFVSAMK